MKLILTFIFFFALIGTIYFISKLFIWVVWKIAPDSFEKPITNTNVLSYNIVMVISAILWSIIYYYSI
jgi:hypothetical protein